MIYLKSYILLGLCWTLGITWFAFVFRREFGDSEKVIDFSKVILQVWGVTKTNIQLSWYIDQFAIHRGTLRNQSNAILSPQWYKWQPFK